ncbi:PAS domain S-box protein [Lentzea sp. NPDC060358]|uniref:PAS domain S-box protein n=1 Tax=Lentzea sp. NPDC060358 TaxID=3347103 RepID=UPI0036536621
MSSVSPSEASYHAIIRADPDNLIVFWSDGAARLFGHSEEQALGQSLELIIPEHLRAAHRKAYSAAMGDSAFKESTLDIPVLLADGQVREHAIRIVALRDAFDVAVGALAIFTSDGRTGITP